MKREQKPGSRVALLEKRRLEAATMFAAGTRTVDVARTLGVAWRTAFKWRQAFIKHGVAGLHSRGSPGREPLLDAAQRKRLAAILRAGAARHGFPDDTWTLARVHEITQRVFGVTCSRVSVWRLLRRTRSTTENASRPE